MQTTDTDLLFQTDKDLKDAARRSKKITATQSLGRPLSLSSKVLRVLVEGNTAWTAESGWQARSIDLKTGGTKRLFRGHTGPVTCVAIFPGPAGSLLLTGSWDKTIKVWDTTTGICQRTLPGHSDFVKSLTILPGPALLSTSSDRTVRLWDLKPLSNGSDPICVQILRQHTRPAECAAWRAGTKDHPEFIVWTADSLGAIKQWVYDEAKVALRLDKELKSHDTSVSQLRACSAGVWSASMDNTAMFHKLDGTQPLRIVETTYIRSILPMEHVEGAEHLLLTGSDDENIRVYDIEDGEKGVPRLLAIVPGHAYQVSDLSVWGSGGAWEVLSASFDQTIRRWSLQDLLHPKQIEDIAPLDEAEEDNGGMTAEEARELEDLLSDSE